MKFETINFFSDMPGIGYVDHGNTMSLTDPDPDDSYIIKSVTGLDADDIIAKFYNVGGGSSPQRYNNITMPPRVVSFVIRLNPDYSVGETPESLRTELQKMIGFSRSGEIVIQFTHDPPETDVEDSFFTATLKGFVTKFESALFTSEPEVQITFECKDPFIKGVGQYYDSSSDLVMPNPSWDDVLSTAPHGFEMILDFTADVAGPLTIQGEYGSTRSPFVIDFDFENGDLLYLSSVLTNRYLYITRDITSGPGPTVYDDPLHLGDKILPNSIWPMMFPGTTHLGISTSSITLDTLTYDTYFWGV